ncbi:MAG TPA: glycosyltransferase [Ilumatobacteraceae bacterium]|nr:glycosyltransferase [Ilumatobacteraceae bacterium]
MRILVSSTPGTGHLNSLLPLCSALKSAGHELLVVTGTESRDYVAGKGFDVVTGGLTSNERRAAYGPRLAETMALPPRERRGLFFAGFFAEIAAPAMRTDLIPVFDQFRPHMSIHERGELASAPMCVARGIPHVTVAFSGALPPWSDQMVIERLEPLWASEGLPRPTMEQINGALYLHPFPPSFGQAPASGNVQPMRPIAGDSGPIALPWLDQLGTARPLVYLTAGTEPAAAQMFPWATALATLGGFDVDVVATVGSHFDPAVVGDGPPNVRIERFVPQQLVLEKASVVVSHAGAGSVLGGATHGVPQLLAPLLADQWENADAATGAGVATTLELDQRSAAHIGDAFEQIMKSDRLKAAATRVAGEIAAMPSPTDHVATIEGLMDGGTSDG